MYMYDQPDEVPTLLDMDSQNLCTPSNSMASLTMPVIKTEPIEMTAMMPPHAIKREPHDLMAMGQLEFIKTEPQPMLDYNHMASMTMNSHMYHMTNYPHPMMHSLPQLPPQHHQLQQHQQQQQQQQHQQQQQQQQQPGQHNAALTQPERKPGKKSKIKQEKITDNFKEKKPRRKVDRFHGTPEEEVAKRTLPDILIPNLDIVIIGINPGLMAAYKGHHYAGPGNHFWKCLYLSGLVDEPMTCMDDNRLLEFSIGFTNIVSRTTRGSSDLTRKEIKDGARILTDKMRKYRPLIACFNGKGIYEIFSGKKDFEVGRQPETMPDTETVIYVMPSSSARCSQFPRATDKVNFYTTLKELRDELKSIKPKPAPALPALPQPQPPPSTTQEQQQQQQSQQQQQPAQQQQQPAQQKQLSPQQQQGQQQQGVKVKQEAGQPANCPGQPQRQSPPVRVKMENQNDCVTTCSTSSSSSSTAYHGTVQGPVPHQSLPALPPHGGPMLIKQEPGSFYPNTCGGQYPNPQPPMPSGRPEPGAMGYPVIKQEMPDPQMRHYVPVAGAPPTTVHNPFHPGYFMDQIPTIGMGENGVMIMRNHIQQQQQQAMGNNHASGNGPIPMPPAPLDPALPNYGHSYPDPRGASPHTYPQPMYPQQHMQQQQQQQQQQQHPPAPPQYSQQMSQQPEANPKHQPQQHPGAGNT